ncbi:hypothetical protein [Marinimicrobium alkaliphilum]|uniref:hypothetical protein n=1 Tax=Marinimicrobium alkaliphilum TaxID=2202654 RepID=UPI000DB914E9|nr:hypothetical protein [Marinimicrobium alkaliphilum]
MLRFCIPRYRLTRYFRASDRLYTADTRTLGYRIHKHTLALGHAVAFGIFHPERERREAAAVRGKYQRRAIPLGGATAHLNDAVLRGFGIAAKHSGNIDGQGFFLVDKGMGLGHPLQVVIELAVAIGIEIGVGVAQVTHGRVGIQAVEPLPPIRQAIVVGIPVIRTVGDREIFVAADIVLVVRQPREVSDAASIIEVAFLSFTNHARVMVIAYRLAGTDIGQDVFVGVGCGMNGRMRREKRLADKGFITIRAPRRYPARLTLVLALHPTGDKVTGAIVTLGAGELIVLGIKRKILLCRRARLVIIVDEIDLVRATVSGPVAPVVNHVVKDIQAPGIKAVGIQPPRQRPVAAIVMGQQVVMETAHVTADTGGETVHGTCGVVAVPGGVERFRDQGALQANVARVAGREGLVERPTDGAAINNGMVTARHANAIRGITRPQAHTHMLQDHVLGTAQAERRAADQDALTRRRLARNSDEAITNDQARLERDGATDIKNNRARAGGLLYRFAQSARAAVCQAGDFDNLTTTPANGKTAITFGARECQLAGLKRPHLAASHQAVGIHLVYPPIVTIPAVGIFQSITDGGLTPLKHLSVSGTHRRFIGTEVQLVCHSTVRRRPTDDQLALISRYMIIAISRHRRARLPGYIRGIDLKTVDDDVLLAGVAVHIGFYQHHHILARYGEGQKCRGRIGVVIHTVARHQSVHDTLAIHADMYRGKGVVCRVGNSADIQLQAVLACRQSGQGHLNRTAVFTVIDGDAIAGQAHVTIDAGLVPIGAQAGATALLAQGNRNTLKGFAGTGAAAHGPRQVAGLIDFGLLAASLVKVDFNFRKARTLAIGGQRRNSHQGRTRAQA